MKLTVTLADGETYDVSTKGIDTVTAERKYKGLTEKNAAEAGYFMAWNVSKREGRTDLDFDPWLHEVEDVDEAEAPEDPLDPSNES